MTTTATTATETEPTGIDLAMSRGRWINNWRPDDDRFWAGGGSRIARRNLVFSVVAEHIGFSVWLLFSIVAAYLTDAGFAFSTDQLFWLVAVPNLVGSVLRIPYTYMVGFIGGRNWTVISATLLVIPLGLLTYCVSNPGTPYWMFMLTAITAGFGGGNFASSMANISYFYPEQHKGTALGVNAAGGNIGVAVVQLLVPLIIGVGLFGAAQGDELWLHNAPLFWMPLALAAAVCAWLFMDNLGISRAPLREQAGALTRKHTWVMSFLYIGTFGSFLGYSAAFPLAIKNEFPEMEALWLAAMGPLVGSLSRPVGGWMADRMGGARITNWTFGAMGGGVLGALLALNIGSFALFFISFMALFILAGVGNGSTYRMIPAIFRAETTAAHGERPTESVLDLCRKHTAAAVGWIAAVGAIGGFFIPRAFATSIDNTGSINTALVGLLISYGACGVVTWWYYQRTAFTAVAPNLASADV